jgi:predicted kinase
MTPPALLIVTGHPATGKTTLANQLASTLRLPLISKDAFKEALFDSLGWSDREWSRRTGAAAIALLYRMAESILLSGRPLILESNFRADLDTPRMYALHKHSPFRPAQIRCVAHGDVLVERIRARIRLGQRHPGHCDDVSEADLATVRTRGDIEPLPIGGDLLTVDTTVPAAIDMAAVTAWARAHVRGDAQE